MSRTQSQGIQYFPFAVDFFSDVKTKILRARYGNDGVMIYLYLLTVVYREGYYTKWTDDLLFIISDDLNISPDTVQQVLAFLVKRSMFDEQLFNSDAVLTSDGIQNRWQEAVKVRAAKRAIEVGKYWILPPENTIPQIKCTLVEYNSENYPLNSENYPLNSENYPQSKVKYSKVKESKGENRAHVGAREDGRTVGHKAQIEFFKRFPLTVDNYSSSDYAEIDFEKLTKAFEESEFLRGMNSFSWVCSNYRKIVAGAYKDFTRNKPQERTYKPIGAEWDGI